MYVYVYLWGIDLNWDHKEIKLVFFLSPLILFS